MDLQKLTKEKGVTTREIAEKICVGLRTAQNYVNGTQPIPEPTQKLIRYEFADFLPKGEGLYSVSEQDDSLVKELKREIEDLKEQSAKVESQQEFIDLQKKTIKSLEDQIKMYQERLNFSKEKSKTV